MNDVNDVRSFSVSAHSRLDAKTKQPFAIALKSEEPYAFAGLWEKWKERAARTDLLTFTIITTDRTKSSPAAA